MIRESASRKLFMVCNYIFFSLICLSVLLPFLNAIAISLSSYEGIVRGGIHIWPHGFNFEGYHKLISSTQFLRSFLNTVFLTAVNTFLVIVISLAAGYALANKHMIGKSIVFYYIIIPMYFSGGLIPTYLLVNKLGLDNSYLALILPNIVSMFYMIVFKNTIEQLPRELMESAEIDGASEPGILIRIILPLILPMTMAFVIFSTVAYWNEWFGVLLYITDKTKWTLQYQLRDILVNASLVDADTEAAIIQGSDRVNPENLKMAALMITVLPIIVVYPFVQKYFIHGQLVGAVKG
ncbi:carbohydrate ABC transporter permease [Paenibacillus nasutitermitis]|uniref:Protein LplC n=1 Tax=Paenibacillus nasutitermitis TaxID=1652958 RepID=A0A916YMS7_9BACL|nr:carbohydrate ABC transporter permease [Paenibacillus nasutitermitis]GGD52442.1 protein LplC [Paenibacillus nasutitermitis]